MTYTRTAEPRYLIVTTFTLCLMAVLLLAWPVQAQAQEATNAVGHLTYTTADGKTITVEISGWVESVLGLLVAVCGSWLLRFALQWLPAAKAGTAYATAIAWIKKLSVATPDRHTDTKVIEQKLAASPTNNLTSSLPPVGASATEIVNRPPNQ